MPRRVPPAGPCGSTLVEVLLAIGVLAWVVLSTAGLFAIGNRQIRSAGRRSRAIVLADSVLAELGSVPFSRLAVRFHCDPAATTCRAVDEIGPSAGSSDLRARVRLEGLGPASLADAMAIRITVWVEWSEGSRTAAVRLTGLRT